MRDSVKIALIIAATAIIAEGLWIYFSPLQVCLRNTEPGALFNCLRWSIPHGTGG